MATTAQSTIRVQFYPTVGGRTVGIDNVSVTPDRAVNGGFNGAGGNWVNLPVFERRAITRPAGADTAAYEGRATSRPTRVRPTEASTKTSRRQHRTATDSARRPR